MSFGIATACEASTTICSAKAPVRSPWTIGWPDASLSGLSRSSGNTSSQNTGAPSAQAGQKPQLRISVATTWSPAFRRVTPAPDRLDHARRLVAVDRRQFAAPGAVDIEDVAVADRAGGGPDQNLARARVPKLDRLDRQRGFERAADGGSGLHGTLGILATSGRSVARSGESSSAAWCGGHAFLRGWAGQRGGQPERLKRLQLGFTRFIDRGE